MPNILVLEDNEDLIHIYEDILSHVHHLHFARTLAELESVRRQPNLNFDLLIADMKLPDGIFLEWAQRNPQLMQELTTVIVSSLEDMDVLTRCFEWGAADYVIKPFKKTDLLVKMGRALGQFNVSKNFKQEEELKAIQDELTSIEAKIFAQLEPEKFVAREMIQPAIWRKVAVHPKTLDVHLSNIRKKLNSTSWSIEFEDHKGWKLTKKTTP